MSSNRATFDNIRSIVLGSITSNYQALVTSMATGSQGPFLFPMRLLHFVNNTNGDMMVSFDGVHDHVIITATTGVIYDITSDEDYPESFRMSANTTVYVKYISAPTTPTDGAFYLTCMYGLGE